MSALRKQEWLSAADIAASQKRAFVSSDRTDTIDATDQANIDTTARRPPQSVATPVAGDMSDRAIDDTYDGEIISSTINETLETPGPRSAASRTSHNRGPQAPDGRGDTHLFDEEELRDFRARWDQVQASFVDEPGHAVELADALVGTLVKRIADQFAEERAELEQQWSRGDNVSTEDLRQGFRHYRAFFDRLLSF